MKNSIIFLIALSILISSCNMPGTSEESPEAIQTYAAQTVEAAIANDQVPLASPTAAGQSTTGSEPFASFEDVTNCRTGPGVNYERITQILPADSVKVVGFYPPNYWIVSTKDGECWVSGEFVTPSGSLAAVPTVTVPPTPQGGSPENVSLQNWFISCNFATNEAIVTIEWSDKDGEVGYRVFRNNELAIEMPANSTFFAETITLLAGQSVGYYVIAFNDAGETSSKVISLSC